VVDPVRIVTLIVPDPDRDADTPGPTKSILLTVDEREIPWFWTVNALPPPPPGAHEADRANDEVVANEEEPARIGSTANPPETL
jgi:hypothetical protein